MKNGEMFIQNSSKKEVKVKRRSKRPDEINGFVKDNECPFHKSTDEGNNLTVIFLEKQNCDGMTRN